MGLPAPQIALLQSLAAYEAPLVVVMFGGSAITVEEWYADADAILMAWYPGTEGGHALADILLDVESPAGGMPMVVPLSQDDLPPFDNESLQVTYDYWHGYRHLARENLTPRFPLGFGLTYSTLEYQNIRLSTDTITADGEVIVSIDVRNSGGRQVSALIQVYTSGGTAVERAPKDLRAFSRVDIEPGAIATVELVLDAGRVSRYWADGAWIYEAGTFTVYAGPNSQELPLEASLSITAPTVP